MRLVKAFGTKLGTVRGTNSIIEGGQKDTKASIPSNFEGKAITFEKENNCHSEYTICFAKFHENMNTLRNFD